MGYFVDLQGNYYEGDRVSLEDKEVASARPTQYHKYDFSNNKWILSEYAVNDFKDMRIAVLREEYTSQMLNAKNDENRQSFLTNKFTFLKNKVRRANNIEEARDVSWSETD